ncbi:MAG: hypothetical protein LBL99_03580 [Holosporaceae bacterium]|jgi:hypothetical protein|nr:hypothetical protein [Holosporaceae bacterium]
MKKYLIGVICVFSLTAAVDGMTEETGKIRYCDRRFTTIGEEQILDPYAAAYWRIPQSFDGGKLTGGKPRRAVINKALNVLQLAGYKGWDYQRVRRWLNNNKPKDPASPTATSDRPYTSRAVATTSPQQPAVALPLLPPPVFWPILPPIPFNPMPILAWSQESEPVVQDSVAQDDILKLPAPHFSAGSWASSLIFGEALI